MRADQVPYKGFKVLDWGDRKTIRLAVAYANHFSVGTFVARERDTHWKLGPEHTRYKFGGCGYSGGLYVDVAIAAPDGGRVLGITYFSNGDGVRHAKEKWDELVGAPLTGWPETVGPEQRFPWLYKRVGQTFVEKVFPDDFDIALSDYKSHRATFEVDDSKLSNLKLSPLLTPTFFGIRIV